MGSKWRSYEEARLFVFDLKLRKQEKWYAYVRGEIQGLKELPFDIPKSPNRVYKGSGWISWANWIRGENKTSSNCKKAYSKKKRKKKADYLPFIDARKYIRSLGFKSIAEWQNFAKGPLPGNVPTQPHRSYGNDGWISYVDWLGYSYGAGKRPHVKKRDFLEAREFVRKLGLRNYNEWIKYCRGEITLLPKLPLDIPKTPTFSYKNDGWVDYPDWLGYETLKELRLSYVDAKKFVHQLKLKSYTQWRKYIRGEYENLPPMPKNLPKAPQVAYKKKGWVNWGDWLGTGSVSFRYRRWRPFEESREFVRTLGLKSEIEWRSYCNGDLVGYAPKPDDIPTSPRRSYKNEFKSVADWLGTGRIANQKRKMRSFEEAREFVRTLKLKNSKEWYSYCKGELDGYPHKPDDIPVNIYGAYKKHFKGMNNWLGKK